MSNSPEVVIAGGGVQGCSIAYHLASRGVQVTLFEKHDLAAAASGASAGGVRHQGRDLREFPLAFRAIPRWPSLADELGGDISYRRGGHLTTIEDEADLPTLAASVAAQQSAGLDIELVQGDELRTLVPGISQTVIAGAHSPHDGHANPGDTTRAFAAAAKRFGASIHIGCTVESLSITAGRVDGVLTSQGRVAADVVVLAAGAWTTALAAEIGLDLPLVAEGYQAMTTSVAPPQLRQVMGSYRRRISLKQLPDGRYLLGGGWPGEFDLRAPRGRTIAESEHGNMEAACGIFPAVANTVIQDAWLGIEAASADEVPIIGPVSGIDGLVLAAGFTGHGFALAPAVGEAVAAFICSGNLPAELADLTLARFAHGIPSPVYPVQKVG